MAACAFATRLFPSVRRRVSGSRASALRVFSGVAARFQLHREDGAAALTGEVDRFGGVTVNLGRIGLPIDISESSFSRLLQGGRGVNSTETRRFKRRNDPYVLILQLQGTINDTKTLKNQKTSHAVQRASNQRLTQDI